MPKQDIPLLSDSFLGAHVLDMLHMEKPANFALDAELAQQVPGLLSNLVVDQEGSCMRSVPETSAATPHDLSERAVRFNVRQAVPAEYLDHDYLTKGTQSGPL